MSGNATPDALRKLANLILRGIPFREIAVAEALRLCASEWEQERADCQAKDKRIRLLEQLQAETVALWESEPDLTTNMARRGWERQYDVWNEQRKALLFERSVAPDDDGADLAGLEGARVTGDLTGPWEE